MLHIRAQFTGQDSLGYEHGRTYDLYIEKAYSSNLLGLYSSTIYIMHLDLTGLCPYRDIETFLANWTRIEVRPEKGDEPC